MAGVSEPQCWAALFDEIDRLRDDIDRMRDDIFGPDGWSETRINPDDCTPGWGT